MVFFFVPLVFVEMIIFSSHEKKLECKFSIFCWFFSVRILGAITGAFFHSLTFQLFSIHFKQIHLSIPSNDCSTNFLSKSSPTSSQPNLCQVLLLEFLSHQRPQILANPSLILPPISCLEEEREEMDEDGLEEIMHATITT